MVGHKPLVAFAQRQHLGALQEAPHALGVFLLVHLSTLSFAPPSCGGRKSGPSQKASCADMGRDPNLARPDRTCGYSRALGSTKNARRLPSGVISKTRTAGSAAAAGAWRELRDLGLLVGRRIIIGRRAASALEEGDTAQTGLGLAILLASLLAAAWAFALGVPIGVCLLGLPGLTLLLRRRLAFFAAVAPTPVVALAEAAHRLDHAEIVIGVLPVGLRQDAVARRRRLAGQRLVLVEHLVGVAADPDVGSAAVEELVAIGRTIGIVMLRLVVVAAATAAAATIATAARSLTIVWSHYLGPVVCRTGVLVSDPLPFPGAVTANNQRD